MPTALEGVQQQRSFAEAGPQPTAEASEKADTLVPEDRVFIKDGRRCWFVRLEEVRLFEAAGNDTRFHVDGEEPLIHRSLCYLEDRL